MIKYYYFNKLKNKYVSRKNSDDYVQMMVMLYYLIILVTNYSVWAKLPSTRVMHSTAANRV